MAKQSGNRSNGHQQGGSRHETQPHPLVAGQDATAGQPHGINRPNTPPHQGDMTWPDLGAKIADGMEHIREQAFDAAQEAVETGARRGGNRLLAAMMYPRRTLNSLFTTAAIGGGIDLVATADNGHPDPKVAFLRRGLGGMLLVLGWARVHEMEVRDQDVADTAHVKAVEGHNKSLREGKGFTVQRTITDHARGEITVVGKSQIVPGNLQEPRRGVGERHKWRQDHKPQPFFGRGSKKPKHP